MSDGSLDKQEYNVEVFGERRMSHRFPLKLRVHYRFSNHPASASVKTQTNNIGMGGLALLSDQPLKAGQTIYLQFFPHEIIEQVDCPECNDQSFELEGRVVWTSYLGLGSGYVSGIEFLNLNDFHSSTLKEILENYELILFPLNQKGNLK